MFESSVFCLFHGRKSTKKAQWLSELFSILFFLVIFATTFLLNLKWHQSTVICFLNHAVKQRRLNNKIIYDKVMVQTKLKRFEPRAIRNKMIICVKMARLIRALYRKISFTISRHWSERCADIMILWKWNAFILINNIIWYCMVYIIWIILFGLNKSNWFL